MRKQRGSTLVEVMAAGIIFVILSLAMIQGFLTVQKAMVQTNKIKTKNEQAVHDIEYEQAPFETMQEDIVFQGDLGSVQFNMTIKDYGGIQTIEGFHKEENK